MHGTYEFELLISIGDAECAIQCFGKRKKYSLSRFNQNQGKKLFKKIFVEPK